MAKFTCSYFSYSSSQHHSFPFSFILQWTNDHCRIEKQLNEGKEGRGVAPPLFFFFFYFFYNKQTQKKH